MYCHNNYIPSKPVEQYKIFVVIVKIEKTAQKRIAKERITELFRQAAERKQYAKRYVGLARKIALRYRVKIPPELRKKYCALCNSLFRFGQNCTVRKKKSHITIHCECGASTRIPTP